MRQGDGGRPSTYHQESNCQYQAKLTICGGLSLFLDLNRAFDSADRCAIFEHLIQLRHPTQFGAVGSQLA